MDTPEQLLARARAGDAADLWRAIAAGEVNDQIAAAWARDVAALVVAKTLNPDIPANRRAELSRVVLGLEGYRSNANPGLETLALEQAPDMTPRELAAIADILVDLGDADRHQIRRKIEYIRQKSKKADR